MYMRAFHVVKIDKKMEVRRTTSYPSLYSAIRAKIGRQDAVLASEEWREECSPEQEKMHRAAPCNLHMEQPRT